MLPRISAQQCTDERPLVVALAISHLDQLPLQMARQAGQKPHDRRVNIGMGIGPDVEADPVTSRGNSDCGDPGGVVVVESKAGQDRSLPLRGDGALQEVINEKSLSSIRTREVC